MCNHSDDQREKTSNSKYEIAVNSLLHFPKSVYFRADFEFVHSQPVYFRPNDRCDRHASQCYNYPVRQLAMGLLDMQKLAHHRLHRLNSIYLQSLYTKCKPLSVISILFIQNIQYVFALNNFIILEFSIEIFKF